MAYIEPNSDIYLLSGVPFDPTYENTMWFEYPRDQAAYFLESENLTRLHLTSYSYIRKTRNQIKVEMPILNARFYNYLMFRNISFESKWFYAFVTEMEYINNTTALITYDIDVIQSWMFDYDFNQCFIEREHTLTDVVGDNIIEEGLETGEYVYADSDWYGAEPIILMARTVKVNSAGTQYIPVDGHVDGGRKDTPSTTEGDYYTACQYIYANPDDPGDPDNPQQGANVAWLNHLIDNMTEFNKINAIVSIFMGDKRAFLINPQTGEPYGFPTIGVYRGNYIGNYGEYRVHNNKLLTFPYNFIQVSNLLGESCDYRWEFFNDKTHAYFERYGNVSLNPGVLLYPKYYKGLDENMEEIVTVNNFPQCAYINDTYKAWLAQNRGMLTAGWIGTAASIVGGVTGNSSYTPGSPSIPFLDMGKESTLPGTKGSFNFSPNTSMLVSGLAGAAALLGKMYDHSTLPPTQHGNNNGDLMYQARNCGFLVSKKCITTEYAKRIDDFFTMYGYKVNRAGTPHISARPCYNYIKTAGCSLKPKLQSGGFEVPADDSRKIESIYDKGIRFWKTTAIFGSYDWSDNNNAPVSNSNQTPVSNDNQGGE